MKVIFLDIDGVLNNHNFSEIAESATIQAHCVASLNRIIRDTGSKLVISSAWRYMILGEQMTVLGFDYLLRTHGVRSGSVISHTRRDEGQRADDIAHWLSNNPHVESWVVIDDEPDGMVASPDGSRFVKTDGQCGLTVEDADKAIDILKRTITQPETA